MLKTLGGYFLMFSSFLWGREAFALFETGHSARFLTLLIAVVALATGIAITSEN